MDSKASECWETTGEEAPEMNGELLMALMDETHVEEIDQDERLGRVIQSLEKEIGPGPSTTLVANTVSSVKPEGGDYEIDCMDCGPENVGSLDRYDGSRGSTCHISDPFDWVDVDMAHNWYLDTYANEGGMVGFDDLSLRPECSYYCYGDASINEDVCSPLWQEAENF